MITHKKYLKALEIVKEYRKQCIGAITEIDRNIDDELGIRNKRLAYELNTRTINILCSDNFGLNYHLSKVSDLESVSISKLINHRGFGKHSLNIIEELCEKANITMLP